MARACNLCGGTSAAKVLETPRLEGPLLRCDACGLLFVDARGDRYVFQEGGDAETRARVSEQIAGAARADLHLDPEIEEAERVVRQRGLARRLDLIAEHRGRGRLLEVGCSGGDLLALALARGYTPQGVEPNQRLAEHAAALAGVPVFPGTLSEARLPPGSADIAVMLHVIEHLPDPAAEVDRLYQVLVPGGLLVVETPSANNPVFRRAPGRWRQIIPEHLWFYTPDTLRRLLEGHGFRVRELRTVGKDVSLRLFANRLRRVLGPLAAPAGWLAGTPLGARTFYMDARDVMIAVAERA